MSPACHCLSLSPDYSYNIQRCTFKDSGLSRGSKVVEYSEGLDSLALEDSYLIWKSHMKTDGRDLPLWLLKSCNKDSLWRASEFLLLLLLLWLQSNSGQRVNQVGSSSVFVLAAHTKTISQHMLLSHALINYVHKHTHTHTLKYWTCIGVRSPSD